MYFFQYSSVDNFFIFCCYLWNSSMLNRIIKYKVIFDQKITSDALSALVLNYFFCYFGRLMHFSFLLGLLPSHSICMIFQRLDPLVGNRSSLLSDSPCMLLELGFPSCSSTSILGIVSCCHNRNQHLFHCLAWNRYQCNSLVHLHIWVHFQIC